MALNRRGGAPRNRTGSQLAQKIAYAATKKDATGCRPTNDPRDQRRCAAGWRRDRRRRCGGVRRPLPGTGNPAAGMVMIRLLSLSG